MTATLQPTTTASGVKAATGASPADVVRKAKEAGVQVVDLRFTDLPGTWTALFHPAERAERRAVCRGDRVRRLLDSRVPGDQRERHAAVPGPGECLRRSVSRSPDPFAHV